MNHRLRAWWRAIEPIIVAIAVAIAIFAFLWIVGLAEGYK